MSNTHECPVDGCQVPVHNDFLMCASHWRLVPAALKSLVYKTWANGRGHITEEHLAASREATAAVNALSQRRT